MNLLCAVATVENHRHQNRGSSETSSIATCCYKETKKCNFKWRIRNHSALIHGVTHFTGKTKMSKLLHPDGILCPPTHQVHLVTDQQANWCGEKILEQKHYGPKYCPFFSLKHLLLLFQLINLSNQKWPWIFHLYSVKLKLSIMFPHARYMLPISGEATG